MDEENESSKAAGAEKSNLEENKNDNSSVHDGGVLDDGGGERKESGIESLHEPKVEISVSETLAHPTVHSSVQQIESDVQSKFDTDSSSAHQLSGTVSNFV